MDLTTVARDVLALLAAEEVALSDDLTQVEQTVREAVLRIGAKAVEVHLADKPLGYQGSSRACDAAGCKGDQKFIEHRVRGRCAR